MFKKVGVDTIYTLVNWRTWDLLRFFDKMGFGRGDMINLELEDRGRGGSRAPSSFTSVTSSRETPRRGIGQTRQCL